MRLRALEESLARLEQRLVMVEQALTDRLPSAAAPEGQPHLPGPVAEPSADPGQSQRPSLWATGGRSEVAAPAGAAAPAGERRVASAEPSSFSLPPLEGALTGRLLAWAGAIALLLAAAFFLSLAFSRGWIGPTQRVIIGFVAGAMLVAAGARWLPRREPLGHVLLGTGVAIVSLALFAATRLYGLVPPEVGLFISVLLTATVAAVAVRVDSQVIALYGLAPLLAAPLVVGAAATPLTLAFIAVALGAAVGVAGLRGWPWLIPLGFVLVGPQLGSWLSDERQIVAGTILLTAFWALLSVGAVAAGEAGWGHGRGGEAAGSPGPPPWIPLALLPIYGISWLAGGLYLLAQETQALRVSFVIAVGLGELLIAALATWRGDARAVRAAHIAALVVLVLGAWSQAPAAISVVTQSALALAVFAAVHRQVAGVRWDRTAHSLYAIAGAAVIGVGVLQAVASVAPPARLVVVADAPEDPVASLGGPVLAFAALSIAFLVGARWMTPFTSRSWGERGAIAAAACAVYGASILLVGVFQIQATDGASVRELRDPAQVTLSVFWALIGGASLAIGLARERRLFRLAGLSLLALATAKVFLVDLAALDVAYRVLSFAGLGLLLLASAYAYQRRRSPGSAARPPG